jgi:hypothetical protein
MRSSISATINGCAMSNGERSATAGARRQVRSGALAGPSVGARMIWHRLKATNEVAWTERAAASTSISEKQPTKANVADLARSTTPFAHG